MQDVLERPDTASSDTDSNEPIFHYAKKDKIAESAVFGTPVVALCGATFPVTRVVKPGSPVCEDCTRIYDQMKRDPAN